MHSLHAGGATAAANTGVPDRLFKRHGRWTSESAEDGYIKSSIERRLQVSKQLAATPVLCVSMWLCVCVCVCVVACTMNFNQFVIVTGRQGG